MGVLSWFKYRSPFGMAFMFQRITGLILLFYLCLHLAYLTSLQSRDLYESLTALTVSKQFFIFDSLLILCGVFHGLNGLRIVVHELGFAHEKRKAVLVISVALTILGWILGSYILYTALGD
ncbi:MAG: succinate dehydrogenase [Archaeoglobaceae archaeon]|uniref:Succinate dehydrogenase n=1 Tax=Archaeoglobus fulgidus TaxID=2234 RepID=A0A7J3M3J4_ARCFL